METNQEKNLRSESAKTRILISGLHSYIGTSFAAYAKENADPSYEISFISLRDQMWESADLSQYDIILHTAGLAHIRETKKNRDQYYKINRDLTMRFAEKAKQSGVRLFIFLSSMSVYGLRTGHITKQTVPVPTSAYGDAKLQADRYLLSIADDSFCAAILRPPMVYGKGCPGNYQLLRKFALSFPVFPDVENQRSMIYIGNLCEFICRVIRDDLCGVFFPQNQEYVCTSAMVKCISDAHHRPYRPIRAFHKLIKKLPLSVLQKVFGDLTYEKVDTVDRFRFRDSIALTEEE